MCHKLLGLGRLHVVLGAAVGKAPRAVWRMRAHGGFSPRLPRLLVQKEEAEPWGVLQRDSSVLPVGISPTPCRTTSQWRSESQRMPWGQGAGCLVFRADPRKELYCRGRGFQ